MEKLKLNNKLKLNDDKTHLLVMTTDAMRRQKRIDIHIDTPTQPIEPIDSEVLLGGIIQEGLKWAQYILIGIDRPLTNEKPLVAKLTTRLNALKKISKIANFKTRLMIANGIFMSKVI